MIGPPRGGGARTLLYVARAACPRPPSYLRPCFWNIRFFARRDVLRAKLVKDLLGAFGFLMRLGMDRDQDVALPDFSLVPFGFIFRNSHADECAGDPTDGCADGRATE